MPAIISVTKDPDEQYYDFRLNRPIMSILGAEFEAKHAAFCAALHDNGLVQTGFTYEQDRSQTVSGYLVGNSPSQYVRIIDVIKAHMSPPAKEVLSTFTQAV